jgi:NADH-quinone oxidoreductase subunit M
MLSHGFVSAALFLCVGVIYDRVHSRRIDSYGGLVHRMPLYAFVFLLFALASVGLPGTSGFVGEFLTLVGAFRVSPAVALLATIGIILGPAYMLWLYRRVIFGELTKDELKEILDLNPREIAIFTPMILLVMLLGIYPEPFIEVIRVSVENLIVQAGGTADGVQSASLAASLASVVE